MRRFHFASYPLLSFLYFEKLILFLREYTHLQRILTRATAIYCRFRTHSVFVRFEDVSWPMIADDRTSQGMRARTLSSMPMKPVSEFVILPAYPELWLEPGQTALCH